MPSKARLIGLDKALKNLEDFSKRIEKEITAESLGVARLVASSVRAKAPKGPTGNLKRSIKAGPLKRRIGQPVASYVRVDRSIAPHAHLVEFGSGPRYEGGAFRGAMTPQPYWRPVIDSINSGTFEPIRRGAKKAIQETKP